MKAVLVVLLGLTFLALGCKKSPDVASGDDAKLPDLGDDEESAGEDEELMSGGSGLVGDEDVPLKDEAGDAEEEEEGDGDEEEGGYGEDEADDEGW